MAAAGVGRGGDGIDSAPSYSGGRRQGEWWVEGGVGGQRAGSLSLSVSLSLFPLLLVVTSGAAWGRGIRLFCWWWWWRWWRWWW